jgi:hypothetical protein
LGAFFSPQGKPSIFPGWVAGLLPRITRIESLFNRIVPGLYIHSAALLGIYMYGIDNLTASNGSFLAAKIVFD